MRGVVPFSREVWVQWATTDIMRTNLYHNKIVIPMQMALVINLRFFSMLWTEHSKPFTVSTLRTIILVTKYISSMREER